MLFWNLSPLRTVSKRRCIITHICFVAWIIHSIRDIRQTWRNVWLCITTAEEPSIQDHVCPLSLCGAKLFRVSMRPCIGSGKLKGGRAGRKNSFLQREDLFWKKQWKVPIYKERYSCKQPLQKLNDNRSIFEGAVYKVK